MSKKKTSLRLLTIALVLIIGGSLLGSWIQTGAGAASVKEVKFYGTYDGLYSAYLFTPDGITTGIQAPGILMVHGFNNSKEYMNSTALEFARRGYVVLSMDLDKHGLSASSKAPSSAANGYGALDGFKYLQSLDIVDKDNVGLLGMSMGGYAIEAAALANPDDYKAMFYMDSSCASCGELRNFAISWGTGSEVPQPFGASNGTEVPTMELAMQTYGTDQPLVPGKVYGSIADGTGKVYYEHVFNHPYSTDDPVSIGNAVDWFGMTISGASNGSLPGSDQIWGWKLFGTGVSFIGFVIFILGLGSLLLKTPYFNSLNDEMPEYKGNKGLAWWVFAIFTSFIGPLTLYKLFLAFFMANYFHLEGVTTGFVGWLFVVGVITIVVLIAGYFAFGKKAGATGVNYGITWEGVGIHWGKIGKALLLALLVNVSAYFLLYLINSWLLVDARFWLITLKVTDLHHFFIMLVYVIPVAIYFVPLAIALHGTLRPNNGQVTQAREMIVNSVMLLVGLLVVLGYYYIPLEFFGAPANFGPGGLGLINAIALIGLLPVVAVISTYFFRKTGRIYVGAFILTFFITWYLVASNALFSLGG